jgi:hypothetical protein
MNAAAAGVPVRLLLLGAGTLPVPLKGPITGRCLAQPLAASLTRATIQRRVLPRR